VGLTYALREELRPHRIQISAVLPGVVHTELSAGIQLPRAVEKFVSVEPEDIAAAVIAATAACPSHLDGCNYSCGPPF
jgi:short-subunit dehydrogenase